jgi:cytoskeleton protein RodZ
MEMAMTAIGEQLREARELKGLDLERVAEETNIAKRYLAALEAEDFGVFPGEPYAIGFLRNYADFLGLSANDLIQTYKNMKIQEAPVPIQDLIPRRGPSRGVIVGAVGGGALVVALVLFFALRGGKPDAGDEPVSRGAPVEYRMDGAPIEKRLYVGDSVTASAGSEKYKILVARIDDAVTFETPTGSSRLMLGEEGAIDLDRNNQPELMILVKDLAVNDPSKGAILRIEYANPEAANEAAAAVPVAANGIEAPASPPASVAAAPAATVSGKGAVLFESPKTPYPFVASVTFRGPCMFRHEIDRKERDERYYRKGETITINANNSIKLWASNAQAVKLVVQASGGKSADLDLGGAGEVAVKRIAWSQSEAGNWILAAADVD